MNYSAEQQRVINFRSGIMRVIAPAGSGKTQVMAGLVKGLVEDGVPEDKILAVTFSNAGVLEMKRKFSRELGHECQVDICTINAKQFEILKDNFAELGYTKVPNVIDTVQRYAIITKILNSNPILEWTGASFVHFVPSRGTGNSALEIVANIFSAVKKTGKNPDDVAYQDVANIVVGTDVSATVAGKIIKLFSKYDAELKKEGLVDYDDQDVLSFKILEDHPGYLDRYAYQYVIIDEFQDTSKTQMEFVKYLKNISTRKGLVVVGDPRQAIYGFRDAFPIYMLKFEEYINAPYVRMTDSVTPLQNNPVEEVIDVELTKNFRSYQEILDTAGEVLGNNDDDPRVVAQRGSSGRLPYLRGFERAADEYKGIADEIDRLHFKGKNYSDIAVIAATKNELSSVADALTKKGIPSFYGAPEPMMDNPRIKAALDFYRVIRDPENTLMALNCANAVAKGDFGEEPITQAVQNIIDTAKKINNTPSEEEKMKLFNGYLDAITDEDETVDSFRSALQNKNFDEVMEYCRDFIEYGKSQEFRRLKAYPGVFLTTAHSSKGLEWETVFMITDKFFFARGGHRLSSALREERARLAYVSATRARDDLYVSGVWYTDLKKEMPEINFLLSCFYEAEDEPFVPVMPQKRSAKSFTKKKDNGKTKK